MTTLLPLVAGAMPSEGERITSKGLRENRGPLVAKMQKLVEGAVAESREMTGEEQEEFDRLDDAQKRFERMADNQAKIEQCSVTATATAMPGEIDPEGPATGLQPSRSEVEIDSPDLLSSWFRSSVGCATPEDHHVLAGCPDIQRGEIQIRFGRKGKCPQTVRDACGVEYRDLTVGSNGAGGYLSSPGEILGSLEIGLSGPLNSVRNASEIISTSHGNNLLLPMSSDVSTIATLVAEAGAVTEQDVAFTQLELGSYKYASLVQVSLELLRDSATNIPDMLGQMFSERLARAQNQSLTSGTGSSQPKGCVTAAADSGVTSASNTALTFSEVLSLEHSVNHAYRESAKAAFMGNDTTLRIMKSIVDSQGRPIWMPSLQDGTPDKFDGFRYVVNPDMSSGASAKALLFGDFSKFIVREVNTVDIRTLVERSMVNGLVDYLCFMSWDSDLLDTGTNPLKYLTLAS